MCIFLTAKSVLSSPNNNEKTLSILDAQGMGEF